jgi:hypothetical protein
MAEQANWQSREGGFESAQGFVRDGLASLRNLENLLKSPRIGPRALGKVVAELRPGSLPLGDALVTLIDLVASRKPRLDVADLRECTRDRAKLMNEAIERAAQSDMGAKSRLQLEAQVMRLVAELDALRDLVVLLDAATGFIPTELDLNALAMESLAKLAPSAVRHPGLVHVATCPAPDGATVVTDTRVIMPLVALGLGFVAKSGIKSLQLTSTTDASGGAEVTCGEHTNGRPATVPCVPPRVLGPSLGVACSAASLVGVTFSFDEAERRVRLGIPAGQVSQTVVRTR